eukprot:6199713-Pleurochrysis_carterae.AAC.2
MGNVATHASSCAGSRVADQQRGQLQRLLRGIRATREEKIIWLSTEPATDGLVADTAGPDKSTMAEKSPASANHTCNPFGHLFAAMSRQIKDSRSLDSKLYSQAVGVRTGSQARACKRAWRPVRARVRVRALQVLTLPLVSIHHAAPRRRAESCLVQATKSAGGARTDTAISATKSRRHRRRTAYSITAKLARQMDGRETSGQQKISSGNSGGGAFARAAETARLRCTDEAPPTPPTPTPPTSPVGAGRRCPQGHDKGEQVIRIPRTFSADSTQGRQTRRPFVRLYPVAAACWCNGPPSARIPKLRLVCSTNIARQIKSRIDSTDELVSYFALAASSIDRSSR